MTDYNDVVPTEGDPAKSYEHIFDIANIPVGAAEPVWLNVPDITALNPAFADKIQSIITYAHKGSQADTKTGSSFTLGFNILKIRDLVGEFQPEWLLLKAAADAKGKANQILIRFYDALGASDAYEGTARVTRDGRPETGAEGVGWDAFTLNGVGEVLPIENPVNVDEKDTSWSVTVAGSPTGGSFQLYVNGKATAPIDHDATAAEIASAVNALAGVTGVAGVTGAGAGPVTLTFPSPVRLLSSSALTGGSNPTVTVA